MDEIGWNLEDLNKISKSGSVFSCFSAGGGSSLGYKLAGWNVIGYNEIDSELTNIYDLNNVCKFKFNEDIRFFKNRKDLPNELFNLDILDGSPPCSNFSLSGDREKSWGVKKKFREGQVNQVLDTLFFDFIDVCNKLKPKIVLCENVKGLISGNAKGYLSEIIEKFNNINYEVQVFLLNSATMNVPQKRERVFIICRRKDLNLKKLVLNFNNKPIEFYKCVKDLNINENEKKYIKSKKMLNLWNKCKPGFNFSTVDKNKNFFNKIKIAPNKVCNTITAHCDCDLYHYKEPRFLSNKELLRIASFPDDYKINNKNLLSYIVGMSVPPKMICEIAKEIKKQWFEVN